MHSPTLDIIQDKCWMYELWSAVSDTETEQRNSIARVSNKTWPVDNGPLHHSWDFISVGKFVERPSEIASLLRPRFVCLDGQSFVSYKVRPQSNKCRKIMTFRCRFVTRSCWCNRCNFLSTNEWRNSQFIPVLM